MKKIFIACTLLIFAAPVHAQQIYSSKNATISFFSSAPIEDIKAKSTAAVSAIDIVSKSVYFKVLIRSFQFRRSLMQEHFNEKYLESEKYPYAEFKGIIIDNTDLSKEGEYKVSIQGSLNIHNVVKNYTIQAVLKVQGGKITAESVFNVKLVDHHVQIPTLILQNIAEQVEVTVSSVMSAYK